MSTMEIKEEREPVFTRRIAKPGPRDEQLALPMVHTGQHVRKDSDWPPIWQDLGYESEEAYMAWLKKVASKDTPLFRSKGPGGHKEHSA